MKNFALLLISLLRNINGDKIHYLRVKTTNTREHYRYPISANINSPMKEIIRKWGRPTLNLDDYIFNILTLDDTPNDIYIKVKQKTKNVNKYMKIIGEALNLNQKVTTYTERHSFATILKIKILLHNISHKRLVTLAFKQRKIILIALRMIRWSIIRRNFLTSSNIKGFKQTT